MKLIEQVRNIISAESDDFFDDNTIVSHLNAGLNQVVSIALSFERRSKNSLRVLDSLRKNVTGAVSKTETEGIYIGTVNKPSFKEIQNITVNNVRVRELTTNHLSELYYGNSKPTSEEYFYHVTPTTITIYTDNPNNQTVVIKGIGLPVPVKTFTEELADVSLRPLTDAILYMAAHRLIMQETVRENATVAFKQEAMEQIELNMY